MSVIIFLPEGLIYSTFRFNALYALIFSKKWKYHEFNLRFIQKKE